MSDEKKSVGRNAYCSWCGAPFEANQAWPRVCGACGNTSYVNPKPVAVALVPVGEGVLAVRRGIEPKSGELALPGGYVDVGESWQQACAREVREETGIELDPAEIEDLCVRSAPGGTVLIFGVTEPLSVDELPEFEPNDEVTERVILEKVTPLAFSLHTEALDFFFTVFGEER